MIYFSGDTHGVIDIGKLLALSPRFTRNDTIIILGDCGVVINPERKTLERYIDLYESIGATIVYIDGNHENFPLLETFPIVQQYGAKAHRIAEHVFHICRGEIMEIEGHTFFCMGGACSMDKAWRIEGKTWWKEEEITESQLQHGLANLERYDNKVDFILTHCIDSYSSFFALRFKPDVCTNKLDVIESVAKYRLWLCGHYHVDRFIAGKKVCLYQRVGYLDEGSDILFSFLDEP